VKKTVTTSDSVYPYFVSMRELGDNAPKKWNHTRAKTLAGAKRQAAKLPRALEADVAVATLNAAGGFDTVATLSDYSAITRRRPVWRDCC
jgi:hypothetical protein